MPKRVDTRKSSAAIIIGTANSEHINGGAGNDSIRALGGNDFVNAGAGDDIIDGGAGSDRLDGDSGDDLAIYVAAENQNGAVRFADNYIGGSGIDTLRLVLTSAEAGSTVLQAEIIAYRTFIAVNTLPNGESKNVDFTFASLNLTANRFEKCEIVVIPEPCGCEDTFVIDTNTVIINGTARDDKIIGGDGNQTFYGGLGDDVISARKGDDQVSGGAGNDTIAGDAGQDTITGNEGDDYLLGNRGNDVVCGGDGNDQVYGGEGDDTIYGNCGSDFVSGDEGNDQMYGGKGADIFGYGNGVGNLQAGNDVIHDFELNGASGIGDKIQFINLGIAFDTYAEVIAAAVQTGDGVVFGFGDGRSLLLSNILLHDLTVDDFIV